MKQSSAMCFVRCVCAWFMDVWCFIAVTTQPYSLKSKVCFSDDGWKHWKRGFLKCEYIFPRCSNTDITQTFNFFFFPSLRNEFSSNYLLDSNPSLYFSTSLSQVIYVTSICIPNYDLSFCCYIILQSLLHITINIFLPIYPTVDIKSVQMPLN